MSDQLFGLYVDVLETLGEWKHVSASIPCALFLQKDLMSVVPKLGCSIAFFSTKTSASDRGNHRPISFMRSNPNPRDRSTTHSHDGNTRYQEALTLLEVACALRKKLVTTSLSQSGGLSGCLKSCLSDGTVFGTAVYYLVTKKSWQESTTSFSGKNRGDYREGFFAGHVSNRGSDQEAFTLLSRVGPASTRNLTGPVKSYQEIVANLKGRVGSGGSIHIRRLKKNLRDGLDHPDPTRPDSRKAT